MEQQFLHLTSQAMLLVLSASLPPILAATVLGVLVALIQALTQVQDQTLPSAVKLVAVVLVLVYAMNYVFTDLYTFAVVSFSSFPQLIR